MNDMRRKYLRVLAAILVLAAGTGCMSDQTRNMADTCNQLLEHGDGAEVRTFIGDAKAHLDALQRPGNALTNYLRDVQDPDAATYKPALTQCVWLLESRRG